MQCFEGDDDGYLAWRSAHLHDGYILNIDEKKHGGTFLHRANCAKLEVPIRKGWNLTRYRKCCSTSEASLREKMRKYPGATAHGCV